MSDVINSLKEILGSYAQKTGPITEEEIQQAIQSLKDPQDSSEPPMEWVAEVMAFATQTNLIHQCLIGSCTYCYVWLR